LYYADSVVFKIDDAFPGGERSDVCMPYLSVVGRSVRAVQYRSGLIRHDVRRDPVDHRLEPVLPADLGPVHAVPVSPRDERMLRGPVFLDAELGYATALCGATVKVVLPQSFDPGDEDSCRRCVGPALRGEDAPNRAAPEEQSADSDGGDEFVDVAAVRVLDRYTLELTWDDDAVTTIDVEPYLWGPGFEPLRDPALFAAVRVDLAAGTVVWPNGADISPEKLRRTSRRAVGDHGEDTG
jgi:hypothetical protein